MQSNDNNIDDPCTSSSNEDTTVDVDHDNEVDSTTHGHLPNRDCDQNCFNPNTVVIVDLSATASDGSENCGATALEIMWTKI